MTLRNNAIPERLRQQLDDAHAGLIRVHKALIDHERDRYEQAKGRIPGAGEFLQILIHDPWFAWLRPISELVVQIDEYTSSKQPVDPLAGEALLAQARRLLVPDACGDDFQRRYQCALNNSTEVAATHGEWRLQVLQSERG
jgi:hypothetical protein